MESERAHTIVVKMAEMVVVKRDPQRPAVLKTTLGSCVGVILADRKSGICGLAHIMLPQQIAGDVVAGKYVDTAVPELLARMRQEGAEDGIEAFVVGGACMFRTERETAFSEIGRRNLEAAFKTIQGLKIPVIFEDTGGNQGRTVVFNCEHLEVTVRTLQKMEIPYKETTGEQAWHSRNPGAGGGNLRAFPGADTPAHGNSRA